MFSFYSRKYNLNLLKNLANYVILKGSFEIINYKDYFSGVIYYDKL